MAGWGKRLIYGVVGWVAAICAVAVAMSVWEFSWLPAKPSIPPVSAVFGFLLLVLISAFAVSSPGWLLGIPYVILVRSSRGPRFWIYLALGTGIGPAFCVFDLLYSFLTHSAANHLRTALADDDYILTLCISAVVSSLTALIYLALLRRADLAEQRRESQPHQA
jgi:hypothetical protein